MSRILDEGGAAATSEPTTTAFYKENKFGKEENIDSYDAVLFTVCDTFGRARGKFAYRDNIRKFAQHGMETPHTKCVMGFHNEEPRTLPRYNNTSSVTYRMYPDLTTLKPLDWLCQDGSKVGHVLCDLHNSKNDRDLSSPRTLALRQLEKLKELGYQFMSAFETEYTIYHKGTTTAYGGDYNELVSMVRLDTDITFYYDLMMGLLASGIPVETQMEELGPGQIEYSMKPLYGIETADATHRLRYVSKSLSERSGLEATFMTKPLEDSSNSGFHFNHSLWTIDGQNAFYDPKDDNNCSTIMRHWIAGVIHHGNALAALMCPTVNCYNRLHHLFAPSDNIWNYSDRNARLRVKCRSQNVYIEDRMSSSACNPYLCTAGLVAAGIDGITRRLEAPPPQIFRPFISGDEKSKPQNPLPRSLEEALQALEHDEILTRELGEEFVQDYIALCKEFQIERLKDVVNKDPSLKFEAERDLFFHTL
ncbi:unnamed protein product [Candidula unifasciata]|uniref:Lengsin n=1 Tax=Candidula unifasciata TaxID=100452 RepID=A0A8S4AFU2_9EUPU|nr:unnamed protein product [Candidula unifasciata]